MMKIAFDVDDTIWKIDRKRRIQVPDYRIIGVLEWFANNGDKVYVWSAGGTDYAQTIVDKLGLTDLVEVIPKASTFGIDIAFDDCETGLGKVDIKVKRDEVPSEESEW